MKTKKLVGLLLTLVMMLSLVTTAFAAQEGSLTGGSITINNAVSGQKYSVYQILYIESYNASANTYAYKANSAWESWLRTQNTYVSFNEQGYVTWVNDADAAAFAKLAQQQAAKMTADDSKTADGATVTFTGLKLGYYLVDTTLGTLCSLDTTNPDVTMAEKNGVPTNVKTVEEDSTKTYGPVNDADIGQTVNFKSTITAQAGAENYVLHDTMSAGLTFGAVTGVTLNGVAVDATCYDVKTDPDDDCTFDVAFTQTFCDTLKANDTIVVAYTAMVNENAKVGLDGNANESHLTYGDAAQSTSTPPSTTTTYTWDMGVLKYGNGDKSKVLAGAKFVLLNNDKTQAAVVVNGKLAGWVAVPAAGEEWPANTELTTGNDGKIEIDGLDADTYYLRETLAPAGYNKLASDVAVTVTGATKAEGTDTLTYATVIAEINNQSGTELPETGGTGTTVLYILGAVLVIGAAVLLITRKRMNDK